MAPPISIIDPNIQLGSCWAMNTNFVHNDDYNDEYGYEYDTGNGNNGDYYNDNAHRGGRITLRLERPLSTIQYFGIDHYPYPNDMSSSRSRASSAPRKVRLIGYPPCVDDDIDDKHNDDDDDTNNEVNDDGSHDVTQVFIHKIKSLYHSILKDDDNTKNYVNSKTNNNNSHQKEKKVKERCRLLGFDESKPTNLGTYQYKIDNHHNNDGGTTTPSNKKEREVVTMSQQTFQIRNDRNNNEPVSMMDATVSSFDTNDVSVGVSNDYEYEKEEEEKQQMINDKASSSKASSSGASVCSMPSSSSSSSSSNTVPVGSCAPPDGFYNDDGNGITTTTKQESLATATDDNGSSSSSSNRQSKTKPLIAAVTFVVEDNWGHLDYTCIYRFRLHSGP